MRFGIVAALDSEAASFEQPHGRLLDGHEYRVVVSGPGRANAARATNSLIDDGCEVLLSWGLAGGLDHTLAAGDVVVASHLRSTGETVLEPDAALVATLCARLDPSRTRRGVVLSIDAPVASRREKAVLHQRYGACAVEMEALAVAQVARSARLPFLCVRAVVDPAGFEVPGAALAGMGEDGRLRPWRTLGALLGTPQQVPAMFGLALHYRRALGALRDTVRRLQ